MAIAERMSGRLAHPAISALEHAEVHLTMSQRQEFAAAYRDALDFVEDEEARTQRHFLGQRVRDSRHHRIGQLLGRPLPSDEGA